MLDEYLLEDATFGQGSYGQRCVVCLASDYSGQMFHKPGCAEATILVRAVRADQHHDAARAEVRVARALERLHDPRFATRVISRREMGRILTGRDPDTGEEM